jgi:hypothetical protein
VGNTIFCFPEIAWRITLLIAVQLTLRPSHDSAALRTVIGSGASSKVIPAGGAGHRITVSRTSPPKKRGRRGDENEQCPIRNRNLTGAGPSRVGHIHPETEK